MGLFDKLFGTYSAREIKRIKPIADQVVALEDEYSKLTDAQLKAKTQEFKNRLSNGETLDDILPEAFATVREASWRVLGMKHFYVQIMGGIVLHQGRIAEMKTGEGKTLVSTLPAYLNALTGEGVHIITVNDYLAKRDSEWMGKVFKFLGLTVGLVIHDVSSEDRKASYNADITYGTNNEFGFDYLRDNMVIYKEQMVQRGHNYVIIDEVDSILIDEARTPLIISGMGGKSSDFYELADKFVKRLKKKVVVETDDKQLDTDVDADYIVDEKANTASLTEKGVKKAELEFGIENLSDPANMAINHHINQALRANGCMRRDIEYVIKDGQIVIVDEFTGRLMPGRRYSDGLHQAIEAKEGVKVEHESKTLATITFQNYFRMYKKLSGMTGTALTEEMEFRQIYNLDVIEIPTNKPLIRNDLDDLVYRSEKAKFNAVVEQVVECYKKGQPVLVGTISIEKSEMLSDMLKRRGVPHQVLNAKNHDKEAQIVAQAGKKGAVTIATNMAGRGTDILLGGNPEFMAKTQMLKDGFSDELINEATGFSETDDAEILNARETFQKYNNKYKEDLKQEQEEVLSLGGLFIIGTERHESRRVDNQLRGRAGRQGDPGVSRFYLSLEDDLMRLFGAERIESILSTLKVAYDEEDALESKMLTGVVENSQKRVESMHFNQRKYVLSYDEVMNEQRKIVYAQRQQVLNGEDMHESFISMIDSAITEAVEMYIGAEEFADNWNIEALKEFADHNLYAQGTFDIAKEEFDTITKEEVSQRLNNIATERLQYQEQVFTPEVLRELERVILLQVVDTKWMDHLDEMEQLKNEIRMRAYGQHDPVVEYRNVGSDLYEDMLRSIKRDTVKYVLCAQPSVRVEREQVAKPIEPGNTNGAASSKTVKRSGEKVGRNDPCPCGSGKKYKKCCGQ